MSKFKVGDKYVVVRPCEFTVGTRVTAIEVEPDDYDGFISAVWEDEDGTKFWLWDDDVEPLYADTPVTAAFIINGANYEYPTLEDAEAGVKAIGNNGVTYEIAQIVKRVTVKRETVVTLEETV